MIKKRPYFYIGLIGLLIIGGGVLLKSTFPKNAAFMPDGIRTPIIFFEFIESPFEVQDFFGVSDFESADTEFVQKMDKGNKIDFAFAVIYAVFLFLFFKKLAELSNMKWYLIGSGLAVLALLGDIFENIQLLGISANLESGNFYTQLELLPVFTWIKWISLAISFAIVAIWFLKFDGVFKFMGYVGMVPIGFAFMAFVKRGLMTELFTKSISIMFFVVICYCFLYHSDMKPRPKLDSVEPF